ncbi:hypothetical protein SUGI_0791710 [Cryptomeria japonica]|nr:hypothetical protein SUGI_0791710 [Cryptomeria japonica]
MEGHRPRKHGYPGGANFPLDSQCPSYSLRADDSDRALVVVAGCESFPLLKAGCIVEGGFMFEGSEAALAFLPSTLLLLLWLCGPALSLSLSNRMETTVLLGAEQRNGKDLSRFGHMNGKDSSRFGHMNGKDSSRFGHVNGNDLLKVGSVNGNGSSMSMTYQELGM